MFSVAENRSTLFWRQSTKFKITRVVVPVNKKQVQRELMWEKDVHKEQRRQVKNNTATEEPPPQPRKKNGEWKKELPQ